MAKLRIGVNGVLLFGFSADANQASAEKGEKGCQIPCHFGVGVKSNLSCGCARCLRRFCFLCDLEIEQQFERVTVKWPAGRIQHQRRHH